MTYKEASKLRGAGPKGTVCLLMVANGLGDIVCALPGIASLAKANRVTIYCRKYHKSLFRNLPVEVIGVSGPSYQEVHCENGEILDMAWDAAHLPSYEYIYKLNNWGGWEDDSQGFNSRARVDQFAEIVDSPIGENFSYLEALQPKEIRSTPFLLLATESTETWRSLPAKQGRALYDELSRSHLVYWMGTNSEHPHYALMHKSQSVDQLVSLVYSAYQVVAVDSGIAHLAGALGKPLVAIGGMTSAKDIFKQYRLFNGPSWKFEAVQGGFSGCLSPCYRNAKRGFTRGLCCGSYDSPKCLEAVDPAPVVLEVSKTGETHSNGFAAPVTTKQT